MTRLYIVHSHELNENGEPGSEYRPRLNQVCEEAQKQTGIILLTGGKATKGIDMRHCDSGRNFLVGQGIDPKMIHIEQDIYGSLETVGEAVFARRDYGELLGNTENIILISSDYHEGRIMSIQEYILGENLGKKLKFIGIPVERHCNTTRTPEMEEKSLDAFKATFAGVPIGDFDRILDTLWKKHPLYKSHPSNPYRDTNVQN